MTTVLLQCTLMENLQVLPHRETTQLHYPDTEPMSPFPILIMPSAWLEIDRYQFKSNWFDYARFEFPNLPKWERDTLLIQPSRLVI